jgi:hypothetical protein
MSLSSHVDRSVACYVARTIRMSVCGYNQQGHLPFDH